MLMKLTRADKSGYYPGAAWINTDSVRFVTLVKKTLDDNKITTRISFDNDDFFDVLETPKYIADFFPGNATRPKGS